MPCLRITSLPSLVGLSGAMNGCSVVNHQQPRRARTCQYREKLLVPRDAPCRKLSIHGTTIDNARRPAQRSGMRKCRSAAAGRLGRVAAAAVVGRLKRKRCPRLEKPTICGGLCGSWHVCVVQVPMSAPHPCGVGPPPRFAAFPTKQSDARPATSARSKLTRVRRRSGGA